MPSELQISKTFFLISGIVNILILLGWSCTSILGGLFTCGIGCLIGIVPMINLVCCIMDFIAYTKLNTLNRLETYGSMQFAAVLEIVTIISGNIVSLIFGIMTLSHINKEEVKNYLKEKGIY
jgi:hypothetical protein